MNFPEIFRYTGSNPQFASKEGDQFGVFRIPPTRTSKTQQTRTLFVIASDGSIDEHCHVGWEHVSVTLPKTPNLTPSWMEMCLVKGLFWGKDQVVVQFHPKESEYVNLHPGCLHLFRYKDGEFPTPPTALV
jgi:hypothetical protein